MGGACRGGCSCLGAQLVSAPSGRIQGERPPWCVCLLLDMGPIDSVSFSPPPSLRSSSGSGSLQRLKAKFLERLHFYLPICSHLAGPGRGAARALAVQAARRCPPLQRMGSLSFPRQLWAAGRTPTLWGPGKSAGPEGRPMASLPALPRAPELRGLPQALGPQTVGDLPVTAFPGCSQRPEGT